MRMRKCANCGERYPINETRCPECSTHAPASRAEAKVVDPICAYNDHGVKCEKYGTLSSSTLGAGPWYCRAHAWVFLHDRGDGTQGTTVRRPVAPREPGQDLEEETA